MPNRTRRPLTISAAAALLVAAAALSACGNTNSKASAPPKTTPATTSSSTATTTTTTAAAPAAGAGGSIPVTLSEYKIKPAQSSTPAGRVEFDVTNAGKLKHQFTIISTTKPAGQVLSKHNPDDDIPGARGEISSIAPGATKKLVIKHLKPGHYAIVCALPGHYQAGMYTDFTVS